jgi:D-alanine-D-alanine ligase
VVEINPDWWKTLFDETYLLTDARSVCDEDVTRHEVDMIERLLTLEKSAAILDLCGGQGRHALELCRRGFRNVTVLDYSEFLIEVGRRAARDSGAQIDFLCADARSTGIPDARFHTVLVMSNSFGYFHDAEDDRRLLCESLRLLRGGGRLLLDLVDPDFFLSNFTPLSWHETDGEIVVCRRRELRDDQVLSREMVLSKSRGLLRDASYLVRIYTAERITRLLESAGFRDIAVRTDYSAHKREGDYGFLTNRMLVVASKPH